MCIYNSVFPCFRHIVLRQDHHDCAKLFLMRGARLDIRNNNGQVPEDCMTGKDPESKNLVKLSTILHAMMADRRARIVTNDITKAKETNPIQCVNDIDDAKEPSDYVYVSKNCVTNSVPIDRNISKLQVAFFSDNERGCWSFNFCEPSLLLNIFL